MSKGNWWNTTPGRVVKTSPMFVATNIAVLGLGTWIGYREQLAGAEAGREASIAAGAGLGFAWSLALVPYWYVFYLATALFFTVLSKEMKTKRWLWGAAFAGVATATLFSRGIAHVVGFSNAFFLMPVLVTLAVLFLLRMMDRFVWVTIPAS